MPGLYSPSAGDVLTAANAIDYWSKQVVIICTSGTRPASPRSGMTIWQTDTLTYLVYGTAWCEVSEQSATVATSQTTTSTSYTDLATSGPAVTVATGTKALVVLTANVQLNTAGITSMAAAVSGATTLAAADAQAMQQSQDTGGSGRQQRCSAQVHLAALTAGSNVFTAKYKVSTGTGTFFDRTLSAVCLPT